MRNDRELPTRADAERDTVIVNLRRQVEEANGRVK